MTSLMESNRMLSCIKSKNDTLNELNGAHQLEIDELKAEREALQKDLLKGNGDRELQLKRIYEIEEKMKAAELKFNTEVKAFEVNNTVLQGKISSLEDVNGKFQEQVSTLEKQLLLVQTETSSNEEIRSNGPLCIQGSLISNALCTQDTMALNTHNATVSTELFIQDVMVSNIPSNRNAIVSGFPPKQDPQINNRNLALTNPTTMVMSFGKTTNIDNIATNDLAIPIQRPSKSKTTNELSVCESKTNQAFPDENEANQTTDQSALKSVSKPPNAADVVVPIDTSLEKSNATVKPHEPAQQISRAEIGDVVMISESEKKPTTSTPSIWQIPVLKKETFAEKGFTGDLNQANLSQQKITLALKEASSFNSSEKFGCITSDAANSSHQPCMTKETAAVSPDVIVVSDTETEKSNVTSICDNVMEE